MLDFRKVLLAAAVAGLGLAGNAFAQAVPSCSLAASPYEGYVSTEGTSEQLPDASVTCTTAATGTLTLTLTASAPITNQTVPNSNPATVDVTVTDNNGNADTYTVTKPGPYSIQVQIATAGSITHVSVTGIRVNANAVPSGATITMSLAVGGAAAGSTVPFAVTSPSISSVTYTSSANTSACGLGASAVSAVTTVNVTATFLDALKTALQVASNPAYANNPSSTAAAGGTMLAFTFSNLNSSGVEYFVPLQISNANITVTAVTSAGVALKQSTVANAPATSALLSVSGGSATVYYQVTTANAAATESFSVPLTEIVPNVAAISVYSTMSPSVSVSLAGFASPAYPGYSSTATYTSTTADTNGLLTACATTILFPYVTNAGGFDTGIAITNASAGLSGGAYSATATAQNGSFSMYFYGTNAPSTNPYVGGIVSGGTVGTPFLLSSVAPGFDGYAIVTANFQEAHGFALITNGTITEGYLGIITNTGNSATAPTF